MNELALTESPSLRAEHAGRVEVLDKVKALTLLPDGVHATTDLVASYFEVPGDAIESVTRRHRAELERNGYQVLRGEQLREFETVNLTVSKQRRSLALFTRRTILNIGQLLTVSPVARAVRTYLLDVEELASPELRTAAVEQMERAAVSRAQVLAYKAAEGLLDRTWLAGKAKVALARMAGEEPEIADEDRPLYVPDFLKSKGLKSAQITGAQSVFGRRAAALHEAEHGVKPGKRSTETSTGAIRETLAWTRRHLPLFEEVWERWYAESFPAAPHLFAVDAGGAR